VVEAIHEHAMFNLVHCASVAKVDVIVRKDSAYRRMEFDRRQQIQVGDLVTWIVSKEDLILSKLSWAQDSRMNDTAPNIADYVRERYSAMKPGERFLIGIGMFDAARALVEASIPADLSGLERRRAICERFYPSLAKKVFPAQ
jgi:acetyl/propionyl-CoA carboxylase alpha subunit